MILTGSNGDSTAEFTIDDGTLKLTDVRCINNSARPIQIEFLNPDDSVKWTATFGPGTDTTRNVPPGQQITAFNEVITKSDGSTQNVLRFLYRFGSFEAAQGQGQGNGPQA